MYTHSHSFGTSRKTAQYARAILVGVNDFAAFEKAVKRESSNYTAALTASGLFTPDMIEKHSNKFLGDAFEWFTEAFILINAASPYVQIANYKPINGLVNHVQNQDIGVDGLGTGSNSKPSTVQVKWRSDPTVELTANEDGLSNFTSASFIHYGVDPADSKNMLIVTNATGLNHYTKTTMFKDKVQCLGRGELSKLTDGNSVFWDQFRAMNA